MKNIIGLNGSNGLFGYDDEVFFIKLMGEVILLFNYVENISSFVGSFI